MIFLFLKRVIYGHHGKPDMSMISIRSSLDYDISVLY